MIFTKLSESKKNEIQQTISNVLSTSEQTLALNNVT